MKKNWGKKRIKTILSTSSMVFFKKILKKELNLKQVGKLQNLFFFFLDKKTKRNKEEKLFYQHQVLFFLSKFKTK